MCSNGHWYLLSSLYEQRKARKNHHELLFRLLPHPSIHLNICKPFPLKSMSWQLLPSHSYYFNSLQVFSILRGTAWHGTHCYIALHDELQEVELCSRVFGWLSGPLWTGLQIVWFLASWPAQADARWTLRTLGLCSGLLSAVSFLCMVHLLGWVVWQIDHKHITKLTLKL